MELMLLTEGYIKKSWRNTHGFFLLHHCLPWLIKGATRLKFLKINISKTFFMTVTITILYDCKQCLKERHVKQIFFNRAYTAEQWKGPL